MISHKIFKTTILIGGTFLLNPIRALPQSEPAVMTARQLVALRKNPLAAQKYAGEIVEIRDAKFGGVTVVYQRYFWLNFSPDRSLALAGVGEISCTLNDDSKELAANLSLGDTITVRGTITAVGAIFSCSIIPKKK